MSSPAKALAGALALAIGGVLLLAQPFDQRVVSVAEAASEAEPAPPVAFTATWGSGPEIRFGRIETSDGITHSTGSAWRPRVISEATDPRLRGTLSIAANSDDYSAASGPSIYSYAFRIENADGAWQQLPTTSIDFGDDDITTTTVGTFVGEGGYEGLIAVFEHRTEDGWHLRGYIIEGQLPPEPEPVVSE